MSDYLGIPKQGGRILPARPPISRYLTLGISGDRARLHQRIVERHGRSGSLCEGTALGTIIEKNVEIARSKGQQSQQQRNLPPMMNPMIGCVLHQLT